MPASSSRLQSFTSSAVDKWAPRGAPRDGGSPEALEELRAAGGEAVLVVYAPWCPYCQALEAEFARLPAAIAPLPVCKFRGDTCREYTRDRLQVAAFPTILFLLAKDGELIKHESPDEQRTTSAALAWWVQCMREWSQGAMARV